MQSIHRSAVAAYQALTRLHLPAAFYSVQVVVPSLGESITDGTIASVLKGAGDQVKENETIAQIETDKVTIDIKAPSDGTILGIVVQEQETVVPGQLVATLDDAAAKANLIGAAPTPAATRQSPVSQPPAAAAPATYASGASAHRTPGIRFPPRIAADGKRISSLPAAEAHAIVQQWQTSSASGTAPAGTTTAAQAPAEAAPTSRSKDTASSLFSGSRPAAPSQTATSTPSKFATSVTVLKQMPARRELTEREMELIELGGAA